jgi:protein-S-isoprenylcysteine O-methyltransferase Ste14
MNERAASPRRIYPPIFLLLASLLMIGLHKVAPGRQLVDGPERYWGIVPMGVGVWIAILVNAMFRRAGTTIKPFQESSALVTSGPFRFSRNPIYLGMVVFLAGLGMLLGSLTPLLIVPAFVLLIDRRFIRAEEIMLARTFSADYDQYRQRVRRWM